MLPTAYRRTTAAVRSPRATERALLAEITAELAGLPENSSAAAMMTSLHRNREIWSAFAAACGAPGNGLPPALRAAIISLALFVDRHSSAVATGRAPVADLIELNQDVMAGLAQAE